MRFKRAGSLAALMAAAVLLDRFTKAWAAALPGGTRPFWPGVLEFRYAENTGMAFSMFAGSGWALCLITALLLASVACWLLLGKHGRCAAAGLALILAGGMSNLYDRIAYGFVVDFINPQFVRFAIFNLADVWVCLGAGLALLGIWLEERKERHP